MEHDAAMALVSDLVRAATELGEEHLKIVDGSMSLECFNASPKLQSAWMAVENEIAPEQIQGFLLSLYSILRNHGADVVLRVIDSGIAEDVKDSHQSIALWLPPSVAQQVETFATGLGMDVSKATALLVITGLQIRHLLGVKAI